MSSPEILVAPSEAPRRLNLGSGRFKKDGFVNVDVMPELEPDVVHDLTSFPYPFTDGQFELIEADHVLEHLDDPFAVMKELHRILSPNGRLVIRVPHCSRGFTHADHKRGFDVTFPHYFDPSFQGGYCGTPFTCERIHLSWFAQPYLKRTVLGHTTFSIARGVSKILDALANASPYLCSRLWCYWVGGFEEIEFVFLPRPDRLG